MEKIVSVPYEDYQALARDAADKAAVILLLNTKFPDDTCQLIAIKALLGIIDKEDDAPDTPADPVDPSDPSASGDPSTTP